MKKIISAILIVLLTVSFTACTSDGGLGIYIDGELPDGAEIAYAEEIELPLAEVRDRDGNTVSFDVTYTVVSADEKRQVGDYPSFHLTPGEYTIEYCYEKGNLKESRAFSVVDHKAPVITFDNVPRDLFLGEQEYGDLPGVSIDEESELENIEYNLYFTDLNGNRSAVQYNAMNETYPITAGGDFEFVVSAKDASGNTAEETVSWMVKDQSWIDSDLEENFVGDFNEKGYRNYIRSGDVSPWWNINGRYNDEWLEQFEGADGVSKIDLEFTAFGHTCINVKLAKPVTSEMIKGKCLAVRAYVVGDDLYGFGFAGIQKQNFSGEISAATISKDLERNAWQTYYLSEEELKSIRMYSVDGKRNSDITNVQFCFSKSGTGGTMSLYIDSISIAEELPKVTGLSVTEKTATWNAVTGAIGYEVSTASSKTVVRETTFEISDSKGLIAVKALGDGIATLDSETEQTVYGLKAKDGEICSFDDALYEYLVVNKVSLGSETSGYTVKNLVTEWKDGRLVANFGAGGWGICSAIKVLFPEKVSVAAGDTLSVTMKIETTDSIREVIVNTTDTTRIGYDTIKEGSYGYSFKIANQTELAGIQLLFITTNSSSISNVKVTFECIKLEKATA